MAKYAIETFDLTKVFWGRALSYFSGWTDVITDVLRNKLRRRKEKIVAVDHVDLKVKRGEFFGLLGPNGAGKTTLIKLLCCLLYPDEGAALVNGFDIRRQRREVKSSVNVIISGGWLGFQMWLTVEQNCMFFAKLCGLPRDVAKRRTREILELLKLEDKRDELPLFLSSGMRQKLLLARAFMIRTPILFLDEPTVGLDPNAAYTVRNFVKNVLNREVGQTIFMTTHYMEEAELLCDRVAIMDRGRIIACGSPDELTKRVKKRGLLEVRAVNVTPSTVKRLEQLNPVEKVVSHVLNASIGYYLLRIHTSNVKEVTSQTIEVIEGEGGRIRRIREVKPSLEDLFIELTGRQIR